jgi:hypothetical protein
MYRTRRVVLHCRSEYPIGNLVRTGCALDFYRRQWSFTFVYFFVLTYRRVMIHHVMKLLSFALAMDMNHSRTSPMVFVPELGTGDHECSGWN